VKPVLNPLTEPDAHSEPVFIGLTYVFSVPREGVRLV
jgi:hypothetical protein